MSKTAVIAALDRELAPLVRHWQSLPFKYNGHNFRVYERDNMIAVAGGIGPAAATLAARAMVDRYHPHVLISAGVAGALLQSLEIGCVIAPNVVIDSRTGRQYRSDLGSGVLVTESKIADVASKQMLLERFHASAIDMEAAAVAAVAQQEGIAFRCIKAISDAADFVMPPLNQFVDDQGGFRTTMFVAWAAFHPLWWARVAALARNTKRASNALCDYLKDMGSQTLEAQPKVVQR